MIILSCPRILYYGTYLQQDGPEQGCREKEEEKLLRKNEKGEMAFFILTSCQTMRQRFILPTKYAMHHKFCKEKFIHYGDSGTGSQCCGSRSGRIRTFLVGSGSDLFFHTTVNFKYFIIM